LATFVYLSFGFLAPKDFYIIFRWPWSYLTMINPETRHAH
jgi:hypothetical protein